MDEIEKADVSASEEPEDRSGDPRIGQWFWVKARADSVHEYSLTDDGDEDVVSPTPRARRGGLEWFGCVVRVGSNYYELESPRLRGSSRSVRIHFDDFDEMCRKEPSPEKVIKDGVDRSRARVAKLLGRVKELTSRLSIVPSPVLGEGSEVRALAMRRPDQSAKDYSTALVRAKEKTLPHLFRQIREANEDAASWMSADVLPMQAQAQGLNVLVKAIEERVFNVELYAGLTEKIVRVSKGAPAPVDEKVRLLQRMCYMDEECLSRYQTGGMSFEDLKDFDRWIARRENRDRILPFPRCVVSFRVRRHAKDRRPPANLIEYFSFVKAYEYDKSTFLYIRNGDQLFRMNTDIKFEEQLYPDVDRDLMSGRLWACGGSIVTDAQYAGMKEEHARAMREWRERMARREADEAAGKEVRRPGPWDWEPSDPTSGYGPFDRTNVHYDDIADTLQRRITRHNRTVLIVQGLLDRSPVFHPHPPWQIWNPDGFVAGIELVLDDSRALVAGDRPDFEAYRTRLNASLKAGSVTVGQERAWMAASARRECERMDRDWRVSRRDRRPVLFRPYGDPGPGKIAKVLRRSGDKLHYEWDRYRRADRWGRAGTIRTTLSVPSSSLLNVDAYTPGDFRIFFNDPRTRSEYLQWAPLLLEAEEYYAGNRKVGSILDEESRWSGGDASFGERDD